MENQDVEWKAEALKWRALVDASKTKIELMSKKSAKLLQLYV
jgi:hypothetical protein